MEYVVLGQSGIKVSKICMGTLTIGPLQANLPVDEGAEVIVTAMDNGINFFDTAQLYKTYPYIKRAVEISGKKPVISTKSYAWDRHTAKETLDEALKETGLDYIDIFMLHEQESYLTLRGHREALLFFYEMKKEGLIRAVGISTHNVEAVEAASQIGEIDIIHPLVNMTGIGIVDGNAEQMLLAIEKAYKSGKGIFTMKALGGGTLISSYEKAINFILEKEYIHSVAIGMQTKEEVIYNVEYFNNKKIPDHVKNTVESKKRRLHVESYCEGCGKCVDKCKQKCLYICNGKVIVKDDQCVMCFYCASVCPFFAIKVV